MLSAVLIPAYFLADLVICTAVPIPNRPANDQTLYAALVQAATDLLKEKEKHTEMMKYIVAEAVTGKETATGQNYKTFNFDGFRLIPQFGPENDGPCKTSKGKCEVHLDDILKKISGCNQSDTERAVCKEWVNNLPLLHKVYTNGPFMNCEYAAKALEMPVSICN